jgi:hypothetical protein
MPPRTSTYFRATKKWRLCGECNEILSKLIPSSISQTADLSQHIADLHADIPVYFANQTPGYRDTRGEVAMTLRTFSAALVMIEFGHYTPRGVWAVGYLAQLLESERSAFRHKLSSLRPQSAFTDVKQEILSPAPELRIHPHDQFINAAIHTLMTARSGSHVLLEETTGLGLTTLAQFVALCSIKYESTR